MYKKYNVDKDNLYYLHKEDIENETKELLREFYPECLEKAIPTPIENLAMKLGLDIIPAILSKDRITYGAFIFNKGFVQVYDEQGKENNEEYEEKTILIDTDLLEKNDGMTRFTIGHEIGHYWTQYELKHIMDGQISVMDLMNKEEKAKYILDNKRLLESPFNTFKNQIYNFSYLEWQPNYFSSCILVPKSTLNMKIKELYPGFLKDQNSSNLDSLTTIEFTSIIDNLRSTFNVSKEMMKNRLNSLEYITRR